MLTLASGAAIALREGELMLCRARAGEAAPALGAHLDTQSGLSGECVRTANILVCRDTESDPRVNLDVCRYLGIRSIAVLPICLGREVVGVFEAFSSHPGAFSANEVAALESMRDLVISVLRPEPQPEAPSALLGTSLTEDGLPLTPLRRPENNQSPAPIPPGENTAPPLRSIEHTTPFRPVQNWPLEPFRPVEKTSAPAPFRPAENQPVEEPFPAENTVAPFRPAENTASPFRPFENRPPLGPSRPSVVPDPDDDLICEIAQQAQSESEKDSLNRAF